MARPTPHLVIDARPRGPRGPIAGEFVLGRPVLAHLVEVASAVQAGPITVHARLDEQPGLRGLMGATSRPFVFATGPPPEGATILRADRLYDERRLRRTLRRNSDPERAALWRIDHPAGLAGAGDELLRRREYQPIGRFWALPPARLLARILKPTPIRPNALTIASGALMLAAAGCVAFGRGLNVARIAPAVAMAIALVLDTSDGHLARIQGTASEFGRWLDATLDELGDMVLHAAIAFAAYSRDGWAGWLGIGMLYAMGKYLFQAATTPSVGQMDAVPATLSENPSFLRSLARLAGHADVRWHLWIILAAVGRLDVGLVAYAAYYPARTAAITARKAANRA